MVDVPIDIVIRNEEAERQGKKTIRTLDDIKRKSKDVSGSTKEMDTSFRNAAKGISTMGGPVGNLTTKFSSLSQILGSTGFALGSMAAATAAAGFAMKNAVRNATEFSTAMAEVRTLVSDDFQFQKFTKSIRGVSEEFGKMPVQQAKAAYQIISAGASTAAQANDMLRASNKLAIGGVTDVAIAADGLTTIMNAYGDKVESATAVSDAMFVAMRAGKTTIGELSSAIGKVAPLAEKTNTSLEELLSATAALTKGGITTRESVTGLRAVLAAVAKPTKEAVDLSKQLGINFSASGLEAKGFAGFIQEIADKTQGSTEVLSQLFGGVEALVPVLALTGAAGDEFSKILEDMGFKAGETEKAFKIMAETPQFAFDQLSAKFKNLSISIGNALLEVIVPATRVLVENFDDIVRIAEILAVVIGVRVVGALTLSTAAFIKNSWAMTAHIGLSANAVAMGVKLSTTQRLVASSTLIAGRAMAVLAGPLAIGAVVGSLFFLDGKVESTTEAINSFMATVMVLGGELLKLVNYTQVPARAMVNAFVGAFGSISDIFDAFKRDIVTFFQNPLSSIGLVQTRAAVANAFVENTVGAVSKAVDEVRNLNDAIDESIDRQLVEWGKQNREAAKSNTEFGEGISDTSDELARLREEILGNNGSGTTGAMDKLGKESSSAKEKVEELTDLSAEQLTASIERAGQNIFDLFENGINDVLSGNIKSWKDYGNEILGIMTGVFSNLGTLALAKPIIVPLLGAAGEAIGLSSNSITGLGESFGVEGLGDLVGSAGSIFDLFSGSGLGDSFLSGTGIGNFIDGIGHDLFGIGQSVIGPNTGIATGVEGIVGGVSSNFTPGASLAGVGGALVANLLGLGGGIGGSIGGTAGGLIGTAVGGPIGAAIGSFLGTAVGGLFGPGRAHPASNAGSTGFDATGTLTGVELSSKHTGTETAQTMVDIVNGVGQFLTAAGADLSVIKSIQTGIDDGTGFFNLGANFKTETNDNLIARFDAGDEAAADTAIGEFAGELLLHADNINGQLSEKTRNLVENVAVRVMDEAGNLVGRTSQEILDDLGFILSFESMFKDAEEAVASTTLVMESINTEFDTMNETMVRLGYSITDINRLEELRAKTIEETRMKLLQDSANAYLAQTNPNVLAAGNLYSNYQNQLNEFNAIGLDTTFIDRTYQVQQENLIQDIIRDNYTDRINFLEDEANAADRLADQYASISESLGDAIRNMRLSDISPLSGLEKVNEARDNFTAAYFAAQGDGPEARNAANKLESLGSQFLDLSRGYYASTDQFTEDFKLVEDALNKTKDKADEQISIQQQIYQSSLNQIDAINNGVLSIVEALGEAEKVQSIVTGELVSANNVNEILVAGLRSGALGQTELDQVTALFNAAGAPVGGGGARTNYFDSNIAANLSVLQAARDLGIKGYNSGGDVLSGEVMTVGENRPEIYKAGRQGGKVIPLENGDQIESRLDAVEKQQQTTNRILSAGFDQLIEQAEKQVKAVKKNTTAVNRA